MKKINPKSLLIVVLAIYVLGVVCLLIPEPSVPVLPNSLRSTEPVDSGQIPAIYVAYYTNLSRQEVIDFYAKEFKKSTFLSIPLFTYRLNHPPEYALETIVDTIHSSFYEELVHPLRESLFISGWIPSQDEAYRNQIKKPEVDFSIEGKRFSTKIILHYVRSPIWARLLVWTGIVGLAVIIFYQFVSLVSFLWSKRK
ncbi:MAG TPA: hypothetical protein VMX76_00650 [Nevskiaceae bacterium]|nr:hypothetical protein [Nevskiaceae bacterium]